MLALFLTAISVLAVPISMKIISLWSRENQRSKFQGCQDPLSELFYDYLGIIKIITATHHLLKRTALANTVNLFCQHGETFASTILTKRVLFTCDLRNIKHLLITHFVDFDSSTV